MTKHPHRYLLPDIVSKPTASDVEGVDFYTRLIPVEFGPIAQYDSGKEYARRIIWPHDTQAKINTSLTFPEPTREWRGELRPIEVDPSPEGQKLESVAHGPLALIDDLLNFIPTGEKKETTTFQIHAIAREITSDEISPEECKALPIADETLHGSFCEGIARCILDWYASPNPYAHHYGPARAFIQRKDISNERAKEAVLVLATALSNTCLRLREHIQSRAPRADYPVVSKNGMLTMDALLCDFLEELGWSQTMELRIACKQRFTEHGEDFDAWKSWFREAQPTPSNQSKTQMNAKFIEYILDAVWPGTAAQLEGSDSSEAIPKALLQGLHHKGSNYGKLDRIGSAVGAWSGGTTARVVNVQHSTYEPLPFLVTLQHQASELLTNKGNKPHQTHIEVVIPRKRSAGADNTEMAMTHNEFLSYIYALQVTPKTGAPVQQDLDTFIRGIKPGVNRIQKRDREEALDILEMLNRIQLKTKTSTGDLFDIVYPSDLDSDDPIQWRWGLQAETIYKKLGTRLKGWAPINRDALYNFNGNQSAHARLYVFLCSMWNDAKDLMTKTFSPDAVPIYSIEELCLFTSLFNEHALSYRRGETSNNSHHGRAKMKMRSILEELAEPEGDRPALLVLDVVKKKRGVMEEVRVLPTAEHIEAMTRIRNERALMSN